MRDESDKATEEEDENSCKKKYLIMKKEIKEKETCWTRKNKEDKK